MSIQIQVALRSKKLGVLIRDARLAARKTVPECAEAIGVEPADWEAWEDGSRSPSLPELEALAYFLQQPLEHFWGKTSKSVPLSAPAKPKLAALAGIRQRMVGAMLRQYREKTGASLEDFSARTGIPVSTLESYELGECPVPLAELEAMLNLLGAPVESMFDRTSPIGQWMNQQKALQEFMQLPPDLQEFISRPVNLPYLKIALKLSNMPTEKLRSVAEDLLEITL